MGENIFDSYLLQKNQFHDFDEMAVVAASAWDQRYRKIGTGGDHGFARQLNMQSAQLSHIGWKSGLLIETGTPTDSVGFVIQVAGDKRLRMNGQGEGWGESEKNHLSTPTRRSNPRFQGIPTRVNPVL